MKFLLVFDFDHTIINDNSDTWIIQCAPEKKLPNGLQNSYEKGKWTEYMGRIFTYLGEQGIKEDDMKRIMIAIPYTPGMTELLQFIAQKKDFFDCIIISDSNTIFIDWILTHANVQNVFDKVFTNPAAFDQVGNLTVHNFHIHNCSKCPKNLCKKKVLEEFVAKQSQNGIQYTKTVYIGDGGNDLCPITFLKKGDIAMPRQGYALQKRIARDIALIDSSISVWSTGAEILSQLKLLLE
ncbi:pyridoxal phosphate phosphatase PHOSPHO2 [Bombina bombina]|uniref:pyridoxal phosphate phosphatase PHOSPHO2 n=1 Tax=Bombina bombina TaxID=8345 RepID=UPI00235A8617|nr:pyridoxal phosphate phosphatase PHOSPHO2 [Bombina bombina]XP_053554388.1 pyridoxal phosphate phosphatase PHOSPHO2 [Bombina bombina]XP_053554389.1 pyridoxal phosphate phosphatase PHOSPHO2 [Bombina bombina]XP_053554390.1 pyridoxal phosphate phosphatase PHOSPHO2 [Bombina bombina]